MKLATLKDRTRDGRLVVVSKDLTRYTDVGHIARTLQAALDDWSHAGPRLLRVAESLEAGGQPVARFHEHDTASPLPRAYQWAEAGGPGVAPGTGPAQRASDHFDGPRDAIAAAAGESEVAVGAGLAVITGDVPRGIDPAGAAGAVCLVLLAGDIRPASGKEDGPSLSAAAFSPVAVTPDELGGAWTGGVASGPLHASRNGTALEEAGIRVDFGALIARMARNRGLSAGTIISMSRNPVATPVTPGDTIRVEMKDAAGHSLFGAIERTVTLPAAADPSP